MKTVLQTQLFKNKRLTITLVAIVFIVSTIFTVIQTFFVLKSDYEKSIKMVNKSIQQIKETRLEAISMAIWQLDSDQLNILIDGILKLPGITYIKIIENDSSIIEKGEKSQHYIIEEMFDLVNKNIEEIKLGTMYIQGSYEKNIEKLIDKTIKTMFIETIKVFSIAFILVLIVHKLIIKHLIAMAEYTKNLDTKRLTTALKLDKKEDKNNPDTIDIVVNAINTMRLNILNDLKEQKKAKIELEEINKKLEEEIKVRKKIEKAALEQKNRIQEQYNTIVKLTVENNIFEKSFKDGMYNLLKESAKTLHVDRISFWKFEDKNTIQCIYRYIVDEDKYINKNKTLDTSGLKNYINYIKKYKIIDVADIYTDPRTADFNQDSMKKDKIKSVLDVIINFHGDIYGIICFETIKKQKQWTQDEISFASRVSEQINNLLMINEWKKVQEEIIELNNSLEKSVEKRTKELKENIKNLKIAQKQLVQSEKMASLGNLVAGVAHEINTPIGISLTGITHFQHITSELKKLYEDDNLSQEEFEEYIKTSYEISNSVYISLQKAAELIKSFKQVAVDQSNEQLREFNLKEYIEEILLSLHNRAKKTKHKIEIECDEKLTIKSYPGAISQILTNFIMNSLIHGFKNKSEGYIKISAKKVDDNLQLIYTDNGKGIDKENLEKIFDPFFTTNREGGGSGLGLNIVYNLVETKLKGKIEVKSLIGVGVTFILTFPLTTKPNSTDNNEQKI